MEKIKNLSIRKSIILYVGLAVLAGFFLSVFCMWSAERVQQRIWRKYMISEGTGGGEEIYDFPRRVERISDEKMTAEDAILSNICDFIDSWSILLISMAGCVLAVFLFYHNKIRRPLELLEYGSQMISKHQLDFQISYSNEDEMGRLCAEFENMRRELEKNNKKMWDMFEQERLLRAAVAHDIRSPLSIIKGYQETLKVFVPNGVLGKDKIAEIAESCLKQVDRLNGFVETMKRLSGVDERKVSKKRISVKLLTERLREMTMLLNQNPAVTCSFFCGKEGDVLADEDMIEEVYENLLSNALRYAVREVRVTVTGDSGFLEMEVCDDGTGFQKDAADVVRAYYHDNPSEDGQHFGLGLYICKLYCEKHGGALRPGNSDSGGACVKATFDVG